MLGAPGLGRVRCSVSGGALPSIPLSFTTLLKLNSTQLDFLLAPSLIDPWPLPISTSYPYLSGSDVTRPVDPAFNDRDPERRSAPIKRVARSHTVLPHHHWGTASGGKGTIRAPPPWLAPSTRPHGSSPLLQAL